MLPALLPLADVGSALTGIAKMLVGYLPQVVALALILVGYTYMFALEDHNRASQAKRAIGVVIGGAILVAVALTWGPDLVTTITK
jgi:type IV secretory pathway VirB2 component (pilin)